MTTAYRVSFAFWICLAVLLSSCASKSITAGTSDTATNSSAVYTIPLGGNTYLTSGTGSGDKVTTDGITSWSSPQSIFSTYFKTEKAGRVQLQLAFSGQQAAGTIKVSIDGQSRELKVKPGDQLVDAGKYNLKAPGYVQVDVQGLQKRGENYGAVKELIVKADQELGLSFVKDNEASRFYWGRRGPSVHLSYTLPAEKNFKWFYSELEVQEGDDPIGSYFMANGFGEGYFGIQVNSPSERRVLFSVWSPFVTDNPEEIPEEEKIKLLKKGEGVYTGEFGNEGSGGQSYFKYNWKAGNTYRFLNSVEPDGKGNTIYTAYFYAPEEGKWKLIASFLRPKTDTWYKRPHSFLENFQDTRGHISRRGLYKNQWARDVDGNWVELTEARFTGDDIARRAYRLDYSGGREGAQFFLRNGGFFDETVAIGTIFSRPTSGTSPVVDFDSLP
ncbi:DUF3472 domain-containing protein [Pontibacter mucosus]|nr:DUF3472 domain-containing protein [Pontibacter mucosus]